MPKGAGKGERRGGRSAGTPNMATTEALLKAQQEIDDAKKKRIPLAKEVLNEFMQLFAGMAAAYQPLPPSAPTPAGRSPDEPKFLKYAVLAIDCAAKLAPYQSHTFRAISVHAADPNDKPPRPGDGAKEINPKDAAAVARVYQQVMKAGAAEG